MKRGSERGQIGGRWLEKCRLTLTHCKSSPGRTLEYSAFNLFALHFFHLALLDSRSPGTARDCQRIASTSISSNCFHHGVVEVTTFSLLDAVILAEASVLFVSDVGMSVSTSKSGGHMHSEAHYEQPSLFPVQICCHVPGSTNRILSPFNTCNRYPG